LLFTLCVGRGALRNFKIHYWNKTSCKIRAVRFYYTLSQNYKIMEYFSWTAAQSKLWRKRILLWSSQFVVCDKSAAHARPNKTANPPRESARCAEGRDGGVLPHTHTHTQAEIAGEILILDKERPDIFLKDIITNITSWRPAAVWSHYDRFVVIF